MHSSPVIFLHQINMSIFQLFLDGILVEGFLFEQMNANII
jgi:hypothetical protein